MARKSTRKGELVSALGLSKFLGRDRGSFAAWVDEGMPCENRPDANGAGEWQFRTAEVVDWLIERETKKAVEKLERIQGPTDEGSESMSLVEAEKMKARWDAVKSKTSALMNVLTLQKEAGDLIEKEVVAGTVETVLQRVRHAFGNLDARVAARVPDVDLRVEMAGIVREEVEEICGQLVMPMDFEAVEEEAPVEEEDAADA